MSETSRQFSGQAVDHGPYRPVVALIEEQVDRTPDRLAVAFRGTSEATLTYAELDALANGLAGELAAAGVRGGDTVPVVIGNSLELPLSLLALMKLGAVFALCDPAWPEDRLRAVFRVIDPRLVLASGPLVCAEQPALVVSAARITPSGERPGVRPGPEEPVYGVFTSGTTGTPKCAVNLQGGLTNRFRFMSRYFGATGAEVVLQNSRHTFDSAIWQLFWPLTTGGRTVIPEQGDFLDLERTVQTIAQYGITLTDFVPATLGMLVALLDAEPSAAATVASLRELVVGGEEIIPHAVHRLRELIPGLGISNGYGPSEASIGMVFHRISEADGDHIPLGRPIDNCYALVADEELRPVPPGETGEIVIGGACLGAGYLGDPLRTAEVFVANPHREMPGERLYRTGDLGWFDERGLLRFAGRRDRQAKVDGVRIELGEIEITAEGCPGVIQAKAMTIRLGGRARLVVAAAAEEGTTPARLRAHLAAVLPRIHVPHHCLVLQTLPLTDNGKVDLAALQEMVEEKLEAEARPAAGPVQGAGTPAEVIASVMGDVLRLPGFRPGDDFLAYGGDSLSALTVVIRVRAELALPVGIADLYAHPTPQALAAAVLDRPADADGEDDDILMELDLRLPADLARLSAEAAAAAPAPSAAGPRAVLLTGATGFVGARTAHELLTTTDTTVVCVVRAADDAHARLRLEAALRAQLLWDDTFAGRLEARAGDLGRHRFGWTREEWEGQAARCEAVLNAGALVNFLFDYRAHRPANVTGATEVLRFALTGRRKHLHHVSTLGVLDRHAAWAGTPLPEDFDPAEAVAPLSGYSRSKWVAERLLRQAARLGAPVTVYRLGEVMPAADTGVPSTKALTHLLLSACHRLGVRPDVRLVSDYTPVDEVAARLVAGLQDPPPEPALHVFRAGSVDFGELTAVGGTPPRPVAPAEFLAALQAAAAEDAGGDCALLHALLDGRSRAEFGEPPGLDDVLTDNPALFGKEACDALDVRSGLTEQPLQAAVTAYFATFTASTTDSSTASSTASTTASTTAPTTASTT